MSHPCLGYLALFLLVAGESAGLPIPGETSLTTAAVLAAQGRLDLSPVIVIASVAAIIGDNIGYVVGRHGGRRLLLRDGIAATRRRNFLKQSEAFYHRRGSITVFLGRWLPILRFTAALLAGTNRMPWPRFLVWNALGGICWATSVSLLAYAIGSRAGNAIQAIGAIGIAMLILIILGHLAWRRLRPPPSANTTPMTHKLFRAAQSQFFVGAAIFAVLGRWLTAGHWTVTAAAALIARPGRQWNRPNAIFLAVLSTQAWATVVLPALARSNAWWDAAHLTVSAAAAPVLYQAVIPKSTRATADPRPAVIALTAATLTLTAGVAWELLEWRIDAALHLHLAKGYADTMHDLLADTAGAVLGGIYLARTRGAAETA